MKKLLILTTTYPKFKDDFATPSFVEDIGIGFQNKFDQIHVLTPNASNLKEMEIIKGNIIHRFNYMIKKKNQTLCNKGGILTNLKKRKRSFLEIIPLSIQFLLNSIKMTKDLKPTIINTHWVIPAGFIGSILKRIFPKTIHIATLHAADVYMLNKFPLKKYLGKIIVKGCDRIYPVSSYVRDVFLNIFSKKDQKLINRKLSVISMGVWTDEFSKSDRNYLNSIRIEYNIGKKTFLIMFLGRLVEKKGLHYLISAINKIYLDYPKKKIKLIICGDGPDREKFERFSRKKCLNNEICEFTGRISDSMKVDLLKISDLFVVPSVVTPEGDTEGLPVVILEAKACGKPIIASDVGGISDAIHDGIDGFLVSQRNVHDLYSKINLLYDNRDLLSQFGSNSYKSSKNYDWKNIIKYYLNQLNI